MIWSRLALNVVKIIWAGLCLSMIYAGALTWSLLMQEVAR